MHVLALDFDGVLCDSSREVFVVAIDAFAAQEPESPLLDRLRPLRDDALSGGLGHRDSGIYRTFLDLLPLGNRAEDFGVSLRVIEDGAAVTDQASYDAFYREVGRDWMDAYHQRFYEVRAELRENDLATWMRLHLSFPGLPEALRRHTGRTKPAVATAKDGVSVRLMLDELGMSDLFDPALILDKDTGIEKTHHLRALSQRTGAEFKDITFVDDKVNHLVKVSELGVRPVLAAWGFNSLREHELARQLGFEVADLDDVDRVLFKGE